MIHGGQVQTNFQKCLYNEKEMLNHQIILNKFSINITRGENKQTRVTYPTRSCKNVPKVMYLHQKMQHLTQKSCLITRKCQHPCHCPLYQVGSSIAIYHQKGVMYHHKCNVLKQEQDVIKASSSMTSPKKVKHHESDQHPHQVAMLNIKARAS